MILYLNKSKKHRIGLDIVLTLYYLYSNDTSVYTDISKEIINKHCELLREKKLITNYNTLTKKGVYLLKEFDIIQDEDFDNFFEEWFNLFPSIKVNGYYVRSNKKECKKKLNLFLKENNFTKEEILEATREYINDCSNRNYEYMKKANNFIYKNNESELFNYCEKIKNYKDEETANLLT
jgi:hydroxymethylpyrimidine pyrophosphatase-like HAD family hydrolase